jgi:long-chain acyl-CoA synthetase
MGYYVDPDNPDQEIVEKNCNDYTVIHGTRYFHTGDIGQITRDGNLQIIDRKKDLFKGPQGEYVSLSKVESIIKLSPFVDMPMVYGKTGASHVVCLISPDEKELKAYLRANGMNTDNLATAAKNPAVVAEIKKSVLKACQEHKLAAFEIPLNILVCVGADGGPAWTPENDLLTAAMKLKRHKIAKVYEKEISALYA